MRKRIVRIGQRYRYCCACRGKLPATFKGFYHPDCLREDKRFRMRKKRERERQQFEALLRRHKCSHCGHRLGKPQSECEASQHVVRERPGPGPRTVEQ
jgi:hypothetical protein